MIPSLKRQAAVLTQSGCAATGAFLADQGHRIGRRLASVPPVGKVTTPSRIRCGQWQVGGGAGSSSLYVLDVLPGASLFPKERKEGYAPLVGGTCGWV